MSGDLLPVRESNMIDPLTTAGKSIREGTFLLARFGLPDSHAARSSVPRKIIVILTRSNPTRL